MGKARAVGLAAVAVVTCAIVLASIFGTVSSAPAATVAAPAAAPPMPAPLLETAPAPSVRRELATANVADAAAKPIAPIVGPALPVQVQFEVKPAGEQEVGEFARGRIVDLIADGLLVARNNTDAMRIPAASRRVAFQAVGYRPVERDVPPLQAGVADFGVVVFEPDAAVRVRLLHAPKVAGAQVLLRVTSRYQQPYAQAACALTAAAVEALLPAPSADELFVDAIVDRESTPALWIAADPVPLRLRTDETATVEIDLGGRARVVVQLRGPTPELWPGLQVSLMGESGPGQFQTSMGGLRLGPDGRGVFHVAPGRCQASLMTGSVNSTILRTVPDGVCVLEASDGEVWDMEPVTPVAGVVVQERNAAAQPSCVSLRAPTGKSATANCHVMARAQLLAAEQVFAWTEANGPLVCHRDDLCVDRDLFVLQPSRCSSLATLCVVTHLQTDQRNDYSVVAEPLTQGDTVRLHCGDDL
ncbi:MAG TPA: hypothetical protein VK348_03570, partial [Planctomycetota bacterium]|nr:hypothetical protein [Planctomycetota bacterium]